MQTTLISKFQSQNYQLNHLLKKKQTCPYTNSNYHHLTSVSDMKIWKTMLFLWWVIQTSSQNVFPFLMINFSTLYDNLWPFILVFIWPLTMKNTGLSRYTIHWLKKDSVKMTEPLHTIKTLFKKLVLIHWVYVTKRQFQTAQYTVQIPHL